MKHTTNMATRRKVDKIELAYIAGLFDGEGHIFIEARKSKNKGKTVVHNLCIGITNTYKEVIDWIYEEFGATRSVRSRWKDHPNWKTCYFWTTSAKKAGEFLKLIYPYLRIKKEQARLAIEFQDNWRDRRFDKKGRVLKTSQKVLEKRENYKTKIHLLNITQPPAETK